MGKPCQKLAWIWVRRPVGLACAAFALGVSAPSPRAGKRRRDAADRQAPGRAADAGEDDACFARCCTVANGPTRQAAARRAPTTVLRTVPLLHFAFAPWGRRSGGAFPPLRISAGKGDHATPGLDPGDGGGRPRRRSDSLAVTNGQNPAPNALESLGRDQNRLSLLGDAGARKGGPLSGLAEKGVPVLSAPGPGELSTAFGPLGRGAA